MNTLVKSVVLVALTVFGFPLAGAIGEATVATSTDNSCTFGYGVLPTPQVEAHCCRSWGIIIPGVYEKQIIFCSDTKIPPS